MTSRRYRRPLALVVLWLLFTLLALLFSPRPPALTWSQGAAGNSLRRAFALSPEPALIVFHRPGGLAPADRAYASRKATEEGAQVYGCDSGETCVISLAADVAELPDLRAGFEDGDAPDGLEVYVTGGAAFAYDAVTSWERARFFVLLCVTVVAWLVALFGKVGPRRALVVCASAGSAGAVTSALAALVAPPSPVALSVVASAGLAGAWAVRLLTPRRLISHTSLPPPDTLSQSAPGSRITPLQRAIIQTGEGTLLQALLIAAGLAGFLFDPRAGGALLLGLVVAVAVSLSETPSLIALLTSPRRPRIIPGWARQKWLRLALALVPIVGLLWLTPSAHPANIVSRKLESAAGYRLLAAADETGDDALALGRLLPFHLLLQAPGVARSEAGLAALRNLVADLSARPSLAAVEGVVAIQDSPTADENQLDPAEQTALLARLERMAADLEVELSAQASELALVAADLQGLELKAGGALSGSLAVTLEEASGRLVSASEQLADARVGLTRVPTEFPELAPRMSDVPDLAILPDVLDAASADLTAVAADLQRAVDPDALDANPQNDSLTAIQDDVEHSLAVIEALAADAASLRAALKAAEAVWAGAALGDATPAAPNPYLVSHDLIRLALIPVGDPYATSALDEAQPLAQAARDGLAGSPLTGSELALTGAPAVAAARRARALQSRFAPGVIVAALAVGFFAWGTLSRARLSLRLTAGAVLSVVTGVGVASVVLWHMDASAIALGGVALLALVGGRMTVEPVSTIEALVLALPPLCLALTGVSALTASGIIMSTGLLAAHFLIAPALSYQLPPTRENEYLR